MIAFSTHGAAVLHTYLSVFAEYKKESCVIGFDFFFLSRNKENSNSPGVPRVSRAKSGDRPNKQICRYSSFLADN